MKAFKCERCGEYYDPMEYDDCYYGTMSFYNPQIVSKEDAREHKFTRYMNARHDFDYKIDLCPRCTNDFVSFMYFSRKEDKDNKEKALAELVRENEELKKQLSKNDEKAIDFKAVIEKLVKNVFGVDDLSVYFNRKQDKSVNEDPEGDSNKRQGG